LEDAIMTGAGEIALPAMVSTLCICIVFVPMFFLTGVARFLFAPLAEGGGIRGLASYALSRTLVPTLVMWFERNVDHQQSHAAASSTSDAQHSTSPNGCGLWPVSNKALNMPLTVSGNATGTCSAWYWPIGWRSARCSCAFCVASMVLVPVSRPGISSRALMPEYSGYMCVPTRAQGSRKRPSWSITLKMQFAVNSREGNRGRC